MAKKKFLKTILTTASSLAVMTGLANDAWGATSTTANNAAAINTAAHWNPASTPQNEDDLKIGTAADGITFNGDGTAPNGGNNFQEIDLDSKDDVSALTIAAPVTIGSIGNAAAANKLATVTFGGAHTLTLSGRSSKAVVAADTYTGLGDINFDGKAATLTVSTQSEAEITLAGAFTNAADATLNAGTNLVVNSETAGDIKTWTIGAGKRLTLDVGNNGVTRNTTQAVYNFGDANSTLKFKIDADGNKDLDLQDGISVAGDNQGIVIIEATSTDLLTVNDSNGASNLGTTNSKRLKELQFAGVANATVGGKLSIFAKKININGTGTYTFTGAIDSGADSSMVFSAAGKVAFSDTADIAKVDFSGQNGVVTLADGKDFTGAFDNSGDTADKGKVTTDGDVTITGTIGATKPIEEIAQTGAKTLTLSRAAKAKKIDVTDNGGKILLNENAEVSELGLTGKVEIADAKSLTLTGALNSTLGNDKIVHVGEDASLVLKGAAAAVTRTYTIGGGTLKKGIVELVTDQDGHTVTLTGGSVGNNGEKLKALNIKGPGKATVTSAVAAVGGGTTVNITKIKVFDGATAVFTSANTAKNTETIEIGEAGGKGTLILRPGGAMDLRDHTTTFGHADSVLRLEANTASRVFTLKSDLASGSSTGKGLVELFSTNTHAVTVSPNANQTLGTTAEPLAELRTSGGNTAAKVQVIVNAKKISVPEGAMTISKTLGSNADLVIGNSTAKTHGKLTFLTAGQSINNGATTTAFETADSTLVFKNEGGGAAQTITLNADLLQNLDGKQDQNGKIEINAAANAVIIDGADKKIGNAADKRFKELKIAGNNAATIKASVFAKDIVLTGNDVASIVTIGNQASEKAALDVGAGGKVTINNQSQLILAGNDTATGVAVEGSAAKSYQVHNVGTVDLKGVASQLTVGNKSFVRGSITNVTADDAGVLSFSGSGVFDGNVGVIGSRNLREVIMTKTGAAEAEIRGDVAANAIKFTNAANKLTVTGNVKTITGKPGINFNSVDATLVLKGTSLEGPITPGADDKGILVFAAEGTPIVKFDATLAGNRMKEIHVDTKGTVQLEQNTDAGLYKFTDSGTFDAKDKNIKTNGAANINFNGKQGTMILGHEKEFGAVDNNAADGEAIAGTLILKGDHGVGHAVTKAIGTTRRIKSIVGQNSGVNASKIKFDEPIKVEEIRSGGDLSFAKVGGDNQLSRIVDSPKVTFAANNSFSNPDGFVDFGTSSDRISEMTLGANNAITFTKGRLYLDQLKTSAGGNGELHFKGAGNVLSFNSKTNHTSNISIGNGAAGDLTLQNNIQSTNFAIYQNSELIIGSTTDKIVGNIVAAGVGDAGQKLRLRNSNHLLLDGDIGTGAAKLSEIILEGDDVSFNNTAFHTNKVTFNSAFRGVTIDFGGNVNVNGINFVNESGLENTIIANGNQTITSAFGASGRPIGNLSFSAAGQTFDINTTQFFGGVTTSVDKQGVLNVNQATPGLTKIGTADKRLKEVKFGANATVTSGLFALDTKIDAGKTVNLNGPVGTDKLTLQGDGAKGVFGPGVPINFAIKTTKTNTGSLEFGATQLDVALGESGARFASVTFNPGDGEIDYNGGDIYADVVNFNAGQHTLERNLNVDGGAKLNDATLNLVNHQLTLRNGTSSFAGALKVNTKLLEGKIGSINVATGNDNQLKLAGLTEGIVTIDDKNGGAPIQQRQSYGFVTVESGSIQGLDVNNISISNDPNSLSRWEFETGANGSINLVRVNQASRSVSNVAAATGLVDVISPETAGFFQNVAQGSQAQEFLDDYNAMDTSSKGDALARLSNPDPASQQVTTSVASAVTSNVGARVALTSAPTAVFTPAAPAAPAAPAGGGNSPAGGGQNRNRVAYEETLITGLAAGDGQDRYGIWFSPFYEDAIQKRRSSTTGYNSQTAGASIGFDAMANENTVIGAAITMASSQVKYKNFKVGDKTKMDSFFGTIYGLYMINSNYFMQGSVTFGAGQVHSTERRRVSNAEFQYAKGKYTSMSIGAEMVGGYNYVMNNQLVVTPQLGLGISNVNDASYKETGTDNQNLEVSRKSSPKVSLLFGLRLSSVPLYFNEVAVTPEVHANLRHDLRGDRSKITAVMDRGVSGQSNVVSSKTPKVNKSYYNAGFSLTAGYHGYEYGFGYDANIASKYVGHQGTLKFRVNF